MTDWKRRRLVFDVGQYAQVTRQRITLAVRPGREITADLYRPAKPLHEMLPVVLFVHGDASQDVLDDVLDWGQYRSWGEAVASVGLAALVFEHRSSAELRFARKVLEDVSDVLALVQERGGDMGLDCNRVGVWTCSAGSIFGATAALLAQPPVACLVSLYGFLDVRHIRSQLDPSVSAEDLAAVSPAAVVLDVGVLPPTLVVKAALDEPDINTSIDAYVAAVGDRGTLEVLIHPAGHHAFDVADADETSADLIRRTIQFLASNLLP